MSQKKHRVAIVGCGRMGQYYAEAYSLYPDTEIVAIAEYNPERRKVVGERFGVKALYPDVQSLLRDDVPDIVAIITPTKFFKDAVIACAQAGVKGISTDKPIAAKLSDADEMVDICKKRGVVFSGGNLQRAIPEVQETARRIKKGEYGKLIGASVHAWGGEISGGGCQHISVLRLLTHSEVDEVIAWAKPDEVLKGDNDVGLIVNGLFHLSNGIQCPVFGEKTPYSGTDVWTADTLVRWNWNPPEIYRGFDSKGNRIKIDPKFQPYEWSQFYYLTGSIRAFIAALDTGSELAVSGHDLRQALEVAIAAKYSALWGSVPLKLPLKDRSLSLFPTNYRWVGGDATGNPQQAEEAAKHVREMR